jgi:hypothetical protein
MRINGKSYRTIWVRDDGGSVDIENGCPAAAGGARQK